MGEEFRLQSFLLELMLLMLVQSNVWLTGSSLIRYSIFPFGRVGGDGWMLTPNLVLLTWDILGREILSILQIKSFVANVSGSGTAYDQPLLTLPSPLSLNLNWEQVLGITPLLTIVGK